VTETLLRRGTKLDRYEIRELIGQGGMGEVYRAWDSALQRDVAVKVLTMRDEAMLQRFEREAKAIGRLDNHNVVEIHDFRSNGAHPYIVMEYLRGESLVDKMKQGAMPVPGAVNIVLAVCRAVSACHSVGIIHRDLKPANVFLAQTAHYGTVVKVLDFGVAKEARYLTPDLTGPGKLVGTPRYVAPEQMRGAEADALSDQYGICLLLYVALTGKPPFFGRKDGKELVWAIVRGEYARPREVRADVSEGLEAVIMKGLNIDRSQRYASVMELGRALVVYASEEDQENWNEYFGHDLPAAAVGEVSGGAVVAKEVTTTELGQEEMAKLARKSAEESATVVDVEVPQGHVLEMEMARVGRVVVPVAPLAEERRVVSPVPHLSSDTNSDRSVVKQVHEPTWTHAHGVIDNEPSKAGRLGARGRNLVIAAISIIAAALVAVAVIVIAAGMKAARDSQESTPPRWVTLVIDEPDAGVGRDAGRDSGKHDHDGKAVGVDAGNMNVEGKERGRDGQVLEKKAPVDVLEKPKPRPAARHALKRKAPKWGSRIQYTKDGSPILF
jgi:hypothetical protein